MLGHQRPPKTPGARYPKTPLKVPLNDENAAHVVGGAKGNLTGRARGNENALTTKSGKKGLVDKSSFVTPMGKQFPQKINPLAAGARPLLVCGRAVAVSLTGSRRTTQQSRSRGQDHQREGQGLRRTAAGQR